MNLNQLPKTTMKGKKRVGRGYGSGKGGHTVGRGAKGDKARGKVGLAFEGTKVKKSLIKRLPLQRGKGKLKPFKNKSLVVNLYCLNLFKKDTKIDLDSLIKEHDNIKYWLAGHTHFSVKTKINECLCMTNPCGYFKENKEYDKEKIINI